MTTKEHEGASFAAALVEEGIVSSEIVERALALLDGGDHIGLGEILSEQPGVDIQAMGERLGKWIGAPWARPDRLTPLPDILAQVSPRLANHYKIVPMEEDIHGRLLIAMSRPRDFKKLDELELILGRPLEPQLAFSVHIRAAIHRFYGVGADMIDQIESRDEGGLVIEEVDLHQLDQQGGASITGFVNQIITEACRQDATDIHLEPAKESLRIRYRIDGMLEDVPVPSRIKKYQHSITSCLKVMARLDIAEQRLPQDGRIQARLGGEAFDLRVSVLPTPLGEGVNLRLLRRAGVRMEMSELGFTSSNLQMVQQAVSRPNGIILFTGPTGSGKTTSLYALLEKINSPKRKIITIEDPIEYNMDDIFQMQVNEDIGFTFARALRSILRHDPDVALVGEIRDSETAEISMRMAMTGHLVFSTLHTNDAASTVARLIDMGQEPYLLASTLSCVVAQRLLRLNCGQCSAPVQPDPATLAYFDSERFPRSVDGFRVGQGCPSCRRTGYRGRTAIHEVYNIDDDFRELIITKAPGPKHQALALEKGLALLIDDGWLRATSGLTTLQEILRVVQV